jgi:hypothetical protein
MGFGSTLIRFFFGFAMLGKLSHDEIAFNRFCELVLIKWELPNKSSRLVLPRLLWPREWWCALLPWLVPLWLPGLRLPLRRLLCPSLLWLPRLFRPSLRWLLCRL